MSGRWISTVLLGCLGVLCLSSGGGVILAQGDCSNTACDNMLPGCAHYGGGPCLPNTPCGSAPCEFRHGTQHGYCTGTAPGVNCFDDVIQVGYCYRYGQPTDPFGICNCLQETLCVLVEETHLVGACATTSYCP